MTKEEIDNFLVSELRKYNLQPSGNILGDYFRFFTTLNRPNKKFATVKMHIPEKSTPEEIKLIINSVVQQHEEYIK